MYSTGPATIVLTEFGSGLVSTHHADKRSLVRALLRHRDYFTLVKEEIAEAQGIWDEEAREDAERDTERAAFQEAFPNDDLEDLRP